MVTRVWVHALWCACVAATAAALCPPCPPPPAGRACTALGSATADECFYHIDHIADDFYYNTAPGYFGLKCVKGLTLEEPALPAFPSRVSVPTVTLWGCGPPEWGADGSEGYATALARLNVSALDRLLLLQLPPAPHRPLRAAHLAGLSSLRALHISALDIASHPVVLDEADASIFSSLPNLETLKLEGVNLPAGALENLKAQNITSLDVIECGVREVPAALCALQGLRRLQVRGATLRALHSACNISLLTLAAPELTALPALHSVIELTLTVKEAIKLEGCESLQKLTVTLTEAVALPARGEWLAACGRLQELRLRLPHVTALGDRALTGLHALRTLSIESNHTISQLKAGLFQDTRHIETLILSRNNFTEFSTDLFAPLTRLRTLDLSHNALSGGASGTLEPLTGLPLRRLLLTRNPLGDLCPPKGHIFIGKQRSSLQGLPELEQLSLQGTGAARVCPDWRDLPLTTLDLRSNNITELWWEDLSWRSRDYQTEVYLADNPLEAITVRQSEYKAASPKDNVMVKFILDNMESDRSLRCDCHFYWFALALRDGVVGVRFESLRCNAPGSAAEGVGAGAGAVGRGEEATAELYERSLPFSQVEPADMVCPLDVECHVNCTCSLSPAAGGALVSCSGRLAARALPARALEGVARALRPGVRLVVRAAGTGLRALPAALPAALAELDLRHNELSALPPAPAAALLADRRRVRLQGNPLLCGCDEPLILQIRDHQDQVTDLESVKCSDGRSVMQALREGCEETGAGPGVWAAGGGALALLSASAMLLALRRAVRLRLKAFLLARGLCLRWARPPDTDPYRYDAFLSYAHEDSAVAAQLLTELEGGGLRLCVHHRDWCAGGWIPHQIAESVAASRRTIVLLSDAFVRSGWARAEFREAHARALQDGAARLLVVLLGAAPPEGLDPEMRRYVAMHTYVRWGEPAFWDKLRAALPAPRHHRESRGHARRNKRPKPQAAATAAPTPTSPSTNSPSQRPPQPPPTPIVKFAQIDFPTPQKPFKQETSPCA